MANIDTVAGSAVRDELVIPEPIEIKGKGLQCESTKLREAINNAKNTEEETKKNILDLLEQDLIQQREFVDSAALGAAFSAIIERRVIADEDGVANVFNAVRALCKGLIEEPVVTR